MSQQTDTRRLVTRLLVVVVAMFGFGFALVPMYDVLCKAFGINGKTAGQFRGEQQVDDSRTGRVRVRAPNAAGMVWRFGPVEAEVRVHPGAGHEVRFVASNPTDRPMTAQAVPSVAPSRAAAWFHKTECFCFTQQVLQP